MAKQITLRNDVGKVQEHTSSLNAIGLKTHRITIQIHKRKNREITPHRPDPSTHQKRTIQETNFATTPTPPTTISSTICQI